MAMIDRMLPFLKWPRITRATLQADLIAGITVALVLIPQSMAYAQLAGLPPYYGLYSAFLPGVAAALFGSSKQLATGPVAVVSLLTASSLLPLATAGSGEFVALAITLSFLVGLTQLALGFLRMGAVVNFLSHPVIIGFTNAAALIIGLSQLSKILGVKMGRSESFLHDIWGVLLQIDHTHIPSLAFGAGAFVIMWVLKRYYSKVPNVLVAVGVCIVFSQVIGFEARLGGAVIGAIPEGLPRLAMPNLDFDVMRSLVPSAIIISLVGFMEAISIAKAMAAKNKDRLDPNQELIGQGLGNVLGCLTQSFPTSGSFSRSAVNMSAGAVSGLSSIITSVVTLLTLLFLTPFLYHLPQPVLAAVIMMAVVGLINFKAIFYAWRANKPDGIAALLTFVATLLVAPHLDKGIMIGAVFAIIVHLYQAMRPRVAILGRFNDGTLRDINVHPHLPTDDRIIAIRFDGQLFFANTSYFEETILSAVASKPNANYILVVGDGINRLDASGEEVIHHIVERLKENGCTVVFSGLKKQVLDVMRRTRLFEMIGGDKNIFADEYKALTDIYQQMKDSRHRPLLHG
ncbi:MAG: sulfate permease [Magnetococcales bacterium]|nr:sulfate permease [Magnetococcales bacterium]